MKAVVFSSILMLGFINFLVAAFYINQTSSINLVSIVTACLIAFTVYVTGFDPLASNIRVFVFVLLCIHCHLLINLELTVLLMLLSLLLLLDQHPIHHIAFVL